MEQICEVLRENVLDSMDLERELPDEELRELIAWKMAQVKEIENWSIKDRLYVEQRVFNSLRKLDILQDLLEDEAITEIMVNGPKQVFYEKAGKFYRYPHVFTSEESYRM